MVLIPVLFCLLSAFRERKIRPVVTLEVVEAMRTMRITTTITVTARLDRTEKKKTDEKGHLDARD